MSDLGFAHAGYVYQDLVTATCAIDVILGRVVEIVVDTKVAGDGDVFDDMTIIYADGTRRRCQIKYQGTQQPLDIDSFVRPQRDLRLDTLVLAANADRETFREHENATTFHIFLRDAPTKDKTLLAVLGPADPDPGPLFEGTDTRRFTFNSDKIWAGVHRPHAGSRAVGDAFKFLREGDNEGKNSVKLDDLAWLCERLIVETNAPAMSSNLYDPGPMERVLLDRIQFDLGAGEYPNGHRSPIDVAGGLIHAAARARISHEPLVRQELLNVTGLRTDFGSVKQRTPVDDSLLVSRAVTAGDFANRVGQVAVPGGFVTIQGDPGQGKSWLSQELLDQLENNGWTVAEHYCYLNDADDERSERVLSEKIFGSLLQRIATAQPESVREQRPLLSADEEALMAAVAQVIETTGMPVALVIDGIDHVTRVRGNKPNQTDPSQAIATEIANLEPPPGCAIVVLSQPGEHLQPLTDVGAVTLTTPPMTHNQVAALAQRLGVIPVDTGTEECPDTGTGEVPDESPTKGRLYEAQPTDLLAVATDHPTHSASEVSSDAPDEQIIELVDLLYERSDGNPLYATYLCRELLNREADAISATDRIRDIPAYDGAIENYYEHLASILDDPGQAAADVMALVDFPVTIEELCSISPAQAPRMARAISFLRPVLRERPGNGLRIYHESFARFLLRHMEGFPDTRILRLNSIASWLIQRGLFKDARAFNSLLPTLSAADRHDDVVRLVDRDFAVNAVAGGFSAAAVQANLATTVSCAGQIEDWAAIARCIDLTRAVQTYQQERFASVVSKFADVWASMLGLDTAADRLLYEGRTVVDADDGVLMCAEIDRLGAVPPWEDYLKLWHIEHDGESDAQYPNRVDSEVELALLRGHLRLVSTAVIEAADSDPATIDGVDLANPVDIEASAPEPNPAEIDRQVGQSEEADPDTRAPGEAQPDQPEAVEVANSENPGNQTDKKADEEIDDQPDADEDDSTRLQRLLDVAVYWAGESPSVQSSRQLVRLLLDTVGETTVVGLSARMSQRGSYCLAISEEINAGSMSIEHGSAQLWATRARDSGVPLGHAHRLAALGVSVSEDAGASDLLLDAARDVQEHHQAPNVARWLDRLVASSDDPLALNAAEAAISGDGWYRGWLKFCVGLVRAEAAAPPERSDLAWNAMDHLKDDLRRNVGSPRAMDLYDVSSLIQASIKRAVALLDETRWRSGIDLLLEVGDAINASIDGEMGIPMPPDQILLLAMDTAPATELEYARELIHRELRHRSHSRFYSDIAEYKLMAARQELRLAGGGSSATPGGRAAHEAGDAGAAGCMGGPGGEGVPPAGPPGAANSPAFDLWIEASRVLLGYGYHKDITIYEVLDPLDALIKYDAAQARVRLQQIQALSYRVWRHTDGRETSHAPTQWWKLLAEADPCAHADLLGRRVLEECDAPSSFESMRRDLWGAHRTDVVASVAAALAFTLADAPTNPDYAKMVLSLVAEGGTVEEGMVQRALTRGDEISLDSSLSPSSGPVLIESLNNIATAHGLRNIQPLAPPNQATDGQLVSVDIDGTSPTPGGAAARSAEMATLIAEAPEGRAGLPYLVRAWRRGESGSLDEPIPDRFSAFGEAIGVRMKALIVAGKASDVLPPMRSLAEVSDFRDSHQLLAVIGSMLAEVGTPEARRAAAQAYALAWTQSRGRSGFFKFGGQKTIEFLHRATFLDSPAAREVIVESIRHAVTSSSYGTMGITQAIIYAFVEGALDTSVEDPATTAFKIWDEAFAVIDARAPAIGDDATSVVYAAPDVSDAEATEEDLNRAFVFAIFAGLAQPSREAKRRTLLALREIAATRPDLFAYSLPIVLRSLRNVLTLTWLLTELVDLHAADPSLVQGAEAEVDELTQSPYLTVRSLARELRPGGGPGGSPAAGPADPLKFPSPLLAPHVEPPPRIRRAVECLRAAATYRVSRADDMVDGFRDAAIETVARLTDDDSFLDRMHENSRPLRSSDDEWPDALLPDSHASEEGLQQVGGAARAILYSRGSPVSDPVVWEAELAGVLSHSGLPLQVEATRVPRPPFDRPPGLDDATWELIEPILARASEDGTSDESGDAPVAAASAPTALVNEADKDKGDAKADSDGGPGAEPPPTLHGLHADESLLIGCLGEEPWAPECAGAGSPFDGWVMVGTVEQRRSEARRRRSERDLRCTLITGVELDPVESLLAHVNPPTGYLSVHQWFEPLEYAVDTMGGVALPLVSRAEYADEYADDPEGLGLPNDLLVPSPVLVWLLGLQPTGDVVMADEAGPAVSLVTWRADYSHSAYHLSYPQLTGSAILLRPDLAHRLIDEYGLRLSMRRHLCGQTGLRRQPLQPPHGRNQP